VLRLRPSSGHGPADILDDLPRAYRCLAMGPGYLVLGPTGAFVVGDGTRNPRSVARELAQWASRFRAAVGDVLSWAPFVDVLVVADRPRIRLESASVVSPDMLVDVLVSGAEMLLPDAVDQLAGLAAQVAGARGHGDESDDHPGATR